MLISNLSSIDAGVRTAAIEALRILGDKQAVTPLLVKLDDPDDGVRKATIGALAQLDDKQVVTPLLAKLDDNDSDVREAVINALGRLCDKQAAAPLQCNLDDPSANVRTAVIEVLVKMRGSNKERMLLSRDFDEIEPWIDPATPITESRIADAALKLGVTSQDVRSFYESIAADYHLRFE